MKKILKRLLISTALITPIAISTPLLLTSCSTNADVNKPVTETGPSIFNQSYGPIELLEANATAGKPKGYYLEANLNENTFNNEIFKQVLAVVPESPKFVDIATPTSKLFKLGDFEETTTAAPNGLTNKVNFSEFKLINQELSTAGKSETILNILKNFVFGSTNSKEEIISYYPSSAFNLEKFKNDIKYDVVYTVRQGDIEDNSNKVIKRVILSDISFTFKLKDTSKPWAGLKTSDPIFVSINWTNDSSATLFKGGFKSAPSITENSKTIDFTGTLNESIFGADASKIDKTDKVKQWFEGVTGDNLNGSGDDSIGTAGLTDANKKISSKIPSIFNNVNNVSNTGASTYNTKAAITFTKEQLLTTFIEGVSTEQLFSTKATPPVALGSQNVKTSIAKIYKKNQSTRMFTIELEFKLTNDNEPGWYGLTGEAARLPIKFILDVTTTAASQGK